MFTISNPSGTIRKNGVEVKQDERDAVFAEYVAFLRAGNGPEVLQDAEPVLPRIEVSAWQIRKALNVTGLRKQVEDAVAASGNIELQDGWNYAPTFWSDLPMTIQLGASLGKSRQEMQALFELAASL